jgi:hypothetical protein
MKFPAILFTIGMVCICAVILMAAEDGQLDDKRRTSGKEVP